MKKEFSFSNNKIMINFTSKYCDTHEKLLSSEGFKRVINSFLVRIKKRNTNSYKFLYKNLKSHNDKEVCLHLIKIFRLLTIMKVEDIISLDNEYEFIVREKESFIELIEEIYSYWRKLERYTIIHNNRVTEGIAAVSFEDANGKFSNLILSLYRKIEENVLGFAPKVYRQIPVGGNAAVLINNNIWPCPRDYEILEDIPFIDKISLETPFITYPKKNTRNGMFKEVFENPLKYCSLTREHWFCYPIKVGELLAFVYFHRDFMSHGISLCNLFEMASEDDYRGKKPDIVFIFGAKDQSNEVKTIFYDDYKNDIMLGYINYSEEIDYFGYMKKMALTLHNLIMIKRGNLPIHGAMVNIVLKSGKSANVVIVGDSGAGKSESLEAFRSLSEEYISDMTIVFDDMGVLKIDNNEVKGYGTEIGAFVRLDDLDQGYAFKEIEKSIFMNPDKINARLVMPVSTYNQIIKGYKVDLFLYANNYQEVLDGENSIEYFSSLEDAITVFTDGCRMAKGTTTEMGLVKSYFANPFGPAQKQEETDVLINKYFNMLKNQGTKIGQIKTCLSISGKEKTGPENAAIQLFNIISSEI